MSARRDADTDETHARFPHQRGIPTIAKFREEKEARKAFAEAHATETGATPDSTSSSGSHEGKLKDQRNKYGAKEEEQPSSSPNPAPRSNEQAEDTSNGDAHLQHDGTNDGGIQDTSEAVQQTSDPKGKRRQFNKGKDEQAERQVTDPVTHLPVVIKDLTSDTLDDVPENEPVFGSTSRTSTGQFNKDKSEDTLNAEKIELQEAYESTKTLFPPPERDVIRKEIQDLNTLGITTGLAGSLVLFVLSVFIIQSPGPKTIARSMFKNHLAQQYASFGIGGFIAALSLGGITFLILGIRDWIQKRVDQLWEDEIWDASQQRESEIARSNKNESTVWLNSLLGSVWPLINPDLFLSLADMLEDVMQASLPSMIQMVSVNDIGQGSQGIRILGVRWLPSGAAARSVGKDGSLGKAKRSSSGAKENGTEEDGESDTEDDGTKSPTTNDDGTEQQVAGGMDAEEGDFINMEIAFAYRARSGRRSLRARSQNMHLHIVFYLAGNIQIPVWVDLRGLVGTMRLRLQLCPDPPFFSLCTLTFMGQPEVDIGCTPLAKHAVNIMDVPLISNFVQSAVNAAMAEYVAPKSLTLDLKDLLAGDDFKKDTHARGIMVVRIKRGYDFKSGDTSIPVVKDGSSDPYVSVGWAKFGKPVWSTRILLNEMEPVWDETAYLLVTPEEVNVGERLRVQLWDSDRMTADDDLGRIEVDLKELIYGEEYDGKTHDRSDGFRALKAGDNMPGKLEWSVGYFPKTIIQDCQLQKQTYDTDVRTMQQLREKVDRISDQKLREARVKEEPHSRDEGELEQLKKQELKTREDAMIISAPPPDGYPSGIFSIQIHQITGLELEKLSNDYEDADQEEGEGLPSAYCTVVINHAKVFRTRTKPKNARPFYNAGTERFIGDWHTAEVFVSVRDARVGENDPLLGIVHLPLADIFKDRSQVNSFYPIMGGAGFGRMRISMVWRSVRLEAPPEALGWSYGTVEVKTPITAADVPENLRPLRIKMRTDIGKGRLYSDSHGKSWDTRKGRSLHLPVTARYASCLTLEFRQTRILKDKTAAFGVLWLRDLPDDQSREITLPIWQGDFERARTCSIKECGQKVGSITLKVTFWSGLGAAHSRWANKDPEMRGVVEILDTARDNLEHMENEKEAGIVDGDVSSDSDDDDGDSSDDSTDDSGDEDHKTKKNGEKKSGPLENVKESLQERAKHEKSLNRRNRGLMQWKIARKAQWAAEKIERTGDKIPELFRHHSRSQDIETEV